MASAHLQPGALAVEGHHGNDPFTNRAQDGQRQRYSAFDNSQFSLYLNGSPMQAKRALEAHLAETTRRLQETSHLGNALLQQRTELESRLEEVEQQEQEDDIGPELRQRLAELEKEFNEVGRETARAFLPRSRVPSGETDITGGGSVYSSEAQNSPTKVSVPSRKQRNQQPSRINDIALATEISTSLLSQLKELQAVLLEKEETLKAIDLDRSQLEIEVEGLSQRLRTLDESESRLKDVNWNLETQVREVEAQAKSAADREHRLNHALNLARSENSTLERELEELKQMHTKLADDHVNKIRQHETELSSLRRNVAMGEVERGAMQRKVEELTAQNQDLARAVAYRMKGEDHVKVEDTSADDGGEEGITHTPEHTPPVSPSKATPRHGMLESETLKHSLQHAHRMIQQLKNNIHREKTEKVELKRMLQDARDELEKDRALNVPTSAGRRRKNESIAFKKPPRPDRLGALRGTQEVVIDEDEWEEQDDEVSTPSRQPKSFNPTPRAVSSGFSSATETSANEGFETANDTSDAAFETANERDGTTTETDAFQTGAETLDGDSSDDLTETEAGARSVPRSNRSFPARHSHHDSYESTASNSGDEYENTELRTPLNHQHSRLRLRSRPGSSRASTPRGALDLFTRTPSVARDSPASISNSNRSTPAQGKSLFAELEDLSGDDDEGSYIEGTPSRSSVLPSRESSPDALGKAIYEKSPLVFHPPRPMMVDSGTMTEASIPTHMVISSVVSHQVEPQAPLPPKLQVSSCSAHETSPRTPLPSRLGFSSLAAQDTVPKSVAVPVFQLSSVTGHATTPQPAPVPPLSLSSLSTHDTAPQLAVAPKSDFSTLYSQDTAPQLAVPPKSNFSTLSSQDTVPLTPTAHVLDLSAVLAHGTEPRHMASPSLGLSPFSTHDTEPIVPTVQKSLPSALDVSTITHQATEPKEGIAIRTAVPAALLSSAVEPSPTTETTRTLEDESIPDSSEPAHSLNTPRIPLQLSTLSVHATEPKNIARVPFSISTVASSQATEPLVVKPAVSRLSTMSSQATEPAVPTRVISQISKMTSQATEPVVPQLPRLQFSSLSSWSTEPMEAPKPSPPALSTIYYQDSKPREPTRPAPPKFSMLSSQATQPIEPPRAPPAQISTTFWQETEPRQPVQRTLPELSGISVQVTEPVASVAPERLRQQFSNVRTVQDTQPESPTLPAFLPTPTSRPSTSHHIQTPTLTMSPVISQVVEPVLLPSRPGTAHRATPLSLGTLKSVQTHGTESKSSAEPATPSPRDREPRQPLTPIDLNAFPKVPRKLMSDGGTQTMVSAEQIDKLLLARNPRWSSAIASAAVEKSLSPPSSPIRRNSNEPGRTSRRPGSAGSVRSRAASPPPLPSDHKEVIAAAAQKLSPPTPGSMGPPAMPASAYKRRPQTPSVKSNSLAPSPRTNGTTPRAHRLSQRGDARSGASSPLSRRSSLSSFTSELDQRFNIPGGPTFVQTGTSAGATDPDQIQGITQTMIGEYLWKYTRRTGRGGMSENRHRRFFWLHPYTRTLYWSDQDPQSAGKTELKAKSVAVVSVQEVEDTNPLPPGLHQMSLIVATPGRSIKFTAPTARRHTTWFQALEYLCKRVDETTDTPEQQERQQNGLQPGSPEVDEIQDEFNGGYRSTSRMTGRSRASVSSHNTRRTVSPHYTETPTLRASAATPHRMSSTEALQNSVSKRIPTFLRPGSTLRVSYASRVSVQDSITPEEPTGSNLDLSREIHEHLHEREIDGMPNVRACCGEGQHDVAHLHKDSVQNRHNHKTVNPRPSVIGSMSSRISSRAESRNEPRSISRNEPRSTSRTSSRVESHAEARNDRIRHQTEMESANFGAGA
ncbi:similar to anucleate primary sterigmata protein A [Plenodomus lingam JN3]|uniref:Similar to anucleate primary sterigmata protein A n=1 Tax=Leptosphaeria maculans (strain JN3 / isolate v23.1.3 / race Av1-4-5-6-7-8) TaxID=985895 RepID=E5A1C8_LEPMJ|nr:similar to anucleate primary sterigmata protein A [Plenodomus lingam JN3]CBX97392.1 similar to anucleate primary sterigmata protein A [Plenodomus lingam JN3]